MVTEVKLCVDQMFESLCIESSDDPFGVSLHTYTRGIQLILLNILAGCTLADLGIVGTTADERCVGLLQNSAQLTGGIVCFTGVIPGSLAVYVCNSTHHLEGSSFRECQSNGNWTGTVPQCVAG